MSHRVKILFLLSPDELKAPYAQVLGEHDLDVTWANSPQALTDPVTPSPPVVVVDLDALPEPLETTLEEVRAAYPVADYIALSSRDSAELALTCVRGGFSDFLTKPVSPEHLTWALQKNLQHQKTLTKLDDPRTGILKAVTQISSCGSATVVRASALDFLRTITKAQGAAWVREEKEGIKVLTASPRANDLIWQLPKLPKNTGRPLSVFKTAEGRKLLYRCEDPRNGMVLLWGIPERPLQATQARAQLLLEHSEQALANLQKLQDIKHRTFVDDLTGLYNSRYLKFALSKCILRAKQFEKKFSVLFIDIDHFKSVNDTHGHLVGSEFLIVIGKTIKNCVRRIDSVFRYGGDEFVVVLQDTELDGAHEIAERIRKNVEQRVFLIKGMRLRSTVSIGVATYPDHASERDTLLKLADEALYHAKKESRNAVHLAGGAGFKIERAA